MLFFAHKLPELCRLCGAPSDVQWTAVVFFQRFFAMHSPMEFHPRDVMFSCVHLACKVEEIKELPQQRMSGEVYRDLLGGILSAAGIEPNTSFRTKMANIELPLLEGIGFGLLVEPKPEDGATMLAEELQLHMAEGVKSIPTMEEGVWNNLSSKAARLVVDAAVCSDMLLRWPTSVLIAAALVKVFQDHHGASAMELMVSVLSAKLPASHLRVTTRRMLEEAFSELQQVNLAGTIAEESMKEIAKTASRCLKIFDRLREETPAEVKADGREKKRKRT